MHRVLANRLRKFRAHSARSGICRIGSAHNFAVFGNRAFTLKHLQHDRRRGHKLAQLAVKRTLGMLGIKHARLRNGQVNALLRRNTQTRVFELGVDLAG